MPLSATTARSRSARAAGTVCRCAWLGALLLSGATAWAQPTVATPPTVQAPTGAPQVDTRYRLRPGDTVEIGFQFTPEFNQSLLVRPDGFITLRIVGDVVAAGFTPAELARAVAAGYHNVLRDPVVDVTVKDFERPYFLVGGEVQRPGKYDLRTKVTVREAVTIAGGFKPSAQESQVLLFRTNGSSTTARTLDVKKILQGHLEEDLVLEPGDMLYAGRNVMSKIERFIPSLSLGLFVNW